MKLLTCLIFTMSGDVQQKSELYRQYEETLKEKTRLSNRPKSKP
jgi:hypothetical protein